MSRDFERINAFEPLLSRYAALLDYEIARLFNKYTDDHVALIHSILSDFYTRNGVLCHNLSSSIITNTIGLLRSCRNIDARCLPRITYVVPVYRCDPVLIGQTIKSIADQIGVDCEGIFVIDGDRPADVTAVQLGIKEVRPSFKASIVVKQRRNGVARARNTGMKMIKTEFFSWLDANDLIHPLRSLYSIVQLINNPSFQRINTRYARVSLRTNKVVIRNLQFSFPGHATFVAYSLLLKQYGFLGDLPYHEDTEYLQRLRHFRVPMLESNLVDYYADINLQTDKISLQEETGSHLSRDTWGEIHTIDNHPAIEASYDCELTGERLGINLEFQERYKRALEDLSERFFPCIE